MQNYAYIDIDKASREITFILLEICFYLTDINIVTVFVEHLFEHQNFLITERVSIKVLKF